MEPEEERPPSSKRMPLADHEWPTSIGQWHRELRRTNAGSAIYWSIVAILIAMPLLILSNWSTSLHPEGRAKFEQFQPSAEIDSIRQVAEERATQRRTGALYVGKEIRLGHPVLLVEWARRRNAASDATSMIPPGAWVKVQWIEEQSGDPYVEARDPAGKSLGFGLVWKRELLNAAVQ